MKHKTPGWWFRQRRVVAAGVVGVLSAGLLVASWTSGGVDQPAAADNPTFDGVATTEAEAKAEAAASGQPVEILSSRSERRDVDANPDGSFTAIEYSEPVRTLKNGSWVATDATLQILPDGTVAPVAATINMVFSGGGDDRLARLEKAGKSVSFGWDTPLPSPVLDGTTATYRNVLPDVDLVINATVTGFSHVLIVKTPEAAANPGISQIDIPITTDGTELRTPESGGVEIVDAATGGIMFGADTPAMWDSGGSSAAAFSTATEEPDRADVDVFATAETLTLTPDPAMLTDPATVYPIYIDPVYSDETAAAWAMVDSGYPSEEYWKFDGKADEGLGRCPVDSGSCAASQVKRLYYQFSGLSGYKGKTIISAQFAVNLRFNWKNANTDDEVSLYKSSKSISSATNWSNKPSGSWVENRNTPAPSGGECSYIQDGAHGTEFNIAGFMAGAASAGTLTLEMRNADESDGHKWMRFCSKGHLRIHYNTPPTQPVPAYMSTSPGKSCATNPLTPAYTNKLPKLTATIADQDSGVADEWGSGASGEPVWAEFKLLWGTNDANTWQPMDGTAAKKFGPKSTAKTPTGTGAARFDLDLALYASQLATLPTDTPITWAVRGWDEKAYSPWSLVTGDNTTRCPFVIDPNAPDAPKVISTDFPDDDSLIPAVGEYGTFTFESTSTDVVSFTFEVPGEAGSAGAVPATLDPSDNKKKATVRWMPTTPGPKTLTVTAFDQTGNSKPTQESYEFNISAASAAGAWDLADSGTGRTAANNTGSNHATAGTGVIFGATGPKAPVTPIPGGPVIPTAVRLDGTSAAYLEAPQRDLVPSAEGFAVSAWVRTNDLTRDQVAVSSNGGGEAGFILGFDADTDSWTFSIPDYDIQAFTHFQATTSGVDLGEWAHLVGVYDAEDRSMRLYVNGIAPETAPSATDKVTRGTWWNASGPIQIGRRYSGFGYADNWNGDIAEVKVFNRVVFANEAAALVDLTPVRTAYWQFSEAAEGGTSPEAGANPNLAMTLAAGASIYSPAPEDVDDGAPAPLVGSGHLTLDGVVGSAATATAPLSTSGSFAVTARVGLAAIPNRDMTVLSVPMAGGDLLVLRYSQATGFWQASITTTVGGSPVTTTVINDLVAPRASAEGQFVAVVFNGLNDELSLYVGGAGGAAPESVVIAGTVSQPSGLRIGADGASGTTATYFSGAIDDVRTFEGVVSLDLLQRLSSTGEHPEL